MSKISIVMPVYNSSKTIIDSINTLLNQTLDDIEIICVDDCSSDDSLSIIREMINKDSRIKLITHTNNMGTLKTRFDGVMASSGKYIMFIDADDKYDLNACEIVFSKMEDTGADMLQFGTKLIYEKLDEKTVSDYRSFLSPYGETLYGENVFKTQFRGMCWHIWNRAYRANVCKIAYKSAGESYLIYSDDLYASFFLAYYSRHFESIKEPLYMYHLETGLSNTVGSLKILKAICNNSHFIYQCIDFLKNENKNDYIEEYCMKHPLLEIDHCIRVLEDIVDVDEKQIALKLMDDTWGHGIFREIYSKKINEYQKRHLYRTNWTYGQYLNQSYDCYLSMCNDDQSGLSCSIPRWPTSSSEC